MVERQCEIVIHYGGSELEVDMYANCDSRGNFVPKPKLPEPRHSYRPNRLTKSDNLQIAAVKKSTRDFGADEPLNNKHNSHAYIHNEERSETSVSG
jgi:hypothetical protein